MIYHILECYFTTLLSIAAACFFMFVTGLWLILKISNRHVNKNNSHVSNATHISHLRKMKKSAKQAVYRRELDVAAISGDNMVTTQLDLARAYIETGNTLLAKKILEYVIEQGDITQRADAKQLLNHC